MTDQPALFDLPTTAQRGEVEPVPVSAGRRQTARIRGVVELGGHPLGYLGARRLPETLDPDERFDPGDPPGRPATCGTCRLRKLWQFGNKRVAKCMVVECRPGSRPGSLYEHHPRYTRSPRSDVRAWWPACTDYRPDLPRLSRDDD